MKIIFILDSLANAGTERSMCTILAGLSANIQPIVVCLHPPLTLQAAYETAGLRVICLHPNGKQSFLSAVKRFVQLLTTEKPSWVISSLFNANMVARLACWYTKIPLIGTFVSDSYHPGRIQKLNLKQRLGFAVVKQIDALTSFIPKSYISNSYSIKTSNCAALGIPSSKVQVVYRGRDSQQITQWQQPVNTNQFVFITMARVLETKGYAELIRAFAQVHQKFPKAQLAIYGSGTFTKNVEALCAELQITDAVTLKGNVLDAWQYLYEAHCFVFPSWYEGLSGALIEAAMTGIPMVVSDIPMNQEVVAELPNALQHRVKDAAHLADCMCNIIHNYAQFAASATQSRMHIVSKFDIQAIAQQYEHAFSTGA